MSLVNIVLKPPIVRAIGWLWAVSSFVVILAVGFRIFVEAHWAFGIAVMLMSLGPPLVYRSVVEERGT